MKKRGTSSRSFRSGVTRARIRCREVDGLPSPALDPYAGITGASSGNTWTMANTNVSLSFRDVYGNNSPLSGDKASGGPDIIDVKVGYTDPLIGIGAWPATTAYFTVRPPVQGQSGALLATIISLQASTHLPAGMQRTSDSAKTAANQLSDFTKIYYQLAQKRPLLLAIDDARRRKRKATCARHQRLAPRLRRRRVYVVDYGDTTRERLRRHRTRADARKCFREVRSWLRRTGDGERRRPALAHLHLQRLSRSRSSRRSPKAGRSRTSRLREAIRCRSSRTTRTRRWCCAAARSS